VGWGAVGAWGQACVKGRGHYTRERMGVAPGSLRTGCKQCVKEALHERERRGVPQALRERASIKVCACMLAYITLWAWQSTRLQNTKTGMLGEMPLLMSSGLGRRQLGVQNAHIMRVEERGWWNAREGDAGLKLLSVPMRQLGLGLGLGLGPDLVGG
jgi:hypothetical protein